MSLTRASDLLNTTQCELIIDRCDLAIKRREEKGGEGHLCHYWRESSEPTATCERGEEEQLFLIIQECLFLPEREG